MVPTRSVFKFSSYRYCRVQGIILYQSLIAEGDNFMILRLNKLFLNRIANMCNRSDESSEVEADAPRERGQSTDVGELAVCGRGSPNSSFQIPVLRQDVTTARRISGDDVIFVEEGN